MYDVRSMKSLKYEAPEKKSATQKFRRLKQEVRRV
jgi:hypothetical protein